MPRAGADMIRVLLADDEQLIRQGFRRLLDMFDDVLVVAEAADGEQALSELARLDIDIVLLDVRMRRMSGLEVLDALKGRAIRPRCLVLTTFDDPELLLEAARRGADGFVSKDITLEELMAAIRAVAAGANWFQPALTSSLRQALLRRRNGALAQNTLLTAIIASRTGSRNRHMDNWVETSSGTTASTDTPPSAPTRPSLHNVGRRRNWLNSPDKTEKH